MVVDNFMLKGVSPSLRHKNVVLSLFIRDNKVIEVDYDNNKFYLNIDNNKGISTIEYIKNIVNKVLDEYTKLKTEYISMSHQRFVKKNLQIKDKEDKNIKKIGTYIYQELGDTMLSVYINSIECSNKENQKFKTIYGDCLNNFAAILGGEFEKRSLQIEKENKKFEELMSNLVYT